MLLVASGPRENVKWFSDTSGETVKEAMELDLASIGLHPSDRMITVMGAEGLTEEVVTGSIWE